MSGLMDIAFGDLGDILCTPSEWTAASAAVGAMHQAMQAAPDAVREKHKANVNGLLLTWNRLEQQRKDSALSRLSPMFWCEFKALGQRAAELARSVAEDSTRAGKPQAAPPRDANLDPGPSTKIAGLAAVAALAVGAAVVVPMLRRRSA
jgi:hypothetical protein